VNLTIPFNFRPRLYQLPLLRAMDEGKRRAVICWHRRSGKDKTLLNLAAKKMLERVGAYFYFFPTYQQGKKVIWQGADKDGFRFLDHFPKQIVKSVNETDMRVELVNGSSLQIIGTDKIDSIVGTNPVGCVFSEFSLQDPKAWEFIRPILAENGGWAVFNFTPRGKNHAWKILQQAKEDPSWFWQVLTVEDTQAIDAQTLLDERREMPGDLYEQEYLCRFVDGAGQFFRRIRESTYNVDLTPLPERGDFQIGVDLAKHQDWTVLTPFNLNAMVAYPQDRFNQVDWNLQKARIEAAALRYGDAKLCVDSTGVGDPIVEDLKARGLNVPDEMAFKFTEQSRQNLLNNLAILLEQGKIRIPNDEGLISELESFRYEMTERGKIKVQCPDGLHDDRVMSLALSVWGVREPLRPDPFLVSKVLSNRAAPKSYR
jgi:hypothetical protein